MLETRQHHYMQSLDYKNVPFRYNNCKSHGHLQITSPFGKPSNDIRGTQLVKTPLDFGTKSLVYEYKGKIKLYDIEVANDTLKDAHIKTDKEI